MPSPNPQRRTVLPVRAVGLGERLDTRGLDASLTQPAQPAPPVVSVGSGRAVLLKYGAVILFGVTALEAEAYAATLAPRIRRSFPRPELEEVELVVDVEAVETAAEGVVVVNELDTARLQLVADVLGKSVVLAYYESAIEEAFRPVERLASNLRARFYRVSGAGALVRHIGETLLIEHQMIWRVSVMDKPELLWTRPDLDRLHARLVEEYELLERQRVLDRKLDVVRRTAEMLLELSRHQRSLRVEWYIVALIVIEIIITVYLR